MNIILELAVGAGLIAGAFGVKAYVKAIVSREPLRF